MIYGQTEPTAMVPARGVRRRRRPTRQAAAGPAQLASCLLLRDLAEDREGVLARVREKAKEMGPKKLSRAVSLYRKYSTQREFQEMLQDAAWLNPARAERFQGVCRGGGRQREMNDLALVEKDYWIMHPISAASNSALHLVILASRRRTLSGGRRAWICQFPDGRARALAECA